MTSGGTFKGSRREVRLWRRPKAASNGTSWWDSPSIAWRTSSLTRKGGQDVWGLFVTFFFAVVYNYQTVSFRLCNFCTLFHQLLRWRLHQRLYSLVHLFCLCPSTIMHSTLYTKTYHCPCWPLPSTTVHYCPYLSTTFTVHLCLLNVRLSPPIFPTVISGHLCENTDHYNVHCPVLSSSIRLCPPQTIIVRYSPLLFAKVQSPRSTLGTKLLPTWTDVRFLSTIVY
jgi:hypothetical protein